MLRERNIFLYLIRILYNYFKKNYVYLNTSEINYIEKRQASFVRINYLLCKNYLLLNKKKQYEIATEKIGIQK